MTKASLILPNIQRDSHWSVKRSISVNALNTHHRGSRDRENVSVHFSKSLQITHKPQYLTCAFFRAQHSRNYRAMNWKLLFPLQFEHTYALNLETVHAKKFSKETFQIPLNTLNSTFIILLTLSVEVQDREFALLHAKGCSLWPHLSGTDLTAQLCQGHSFTLQQWARCRFRAGHWREGFTHAWVLIDLLTLPDTTLHSFLPYHLYVSWQKTLAPSRHPASQDTQTILLSLSPPVTEWMNLNKSLPPSFSYIFLHCSLSLLMYSTYFPQHWRQLKCPSYFCIQTWTFVENFAKWNF